MGRIGRVMQSALVDLGPLRRHRDFRFLYLAQGVSLLGTMITLVAVPYQVYRLTHSSLAVGLLGLAEFAPLVVATTFGGVLADGRDRRRVIRLAQAGRLLISVALVANAWQHQPHLWVLYAAAAASAGLAGIERPSMEAMVPQLVARADLPAVAALEGFEGTVAMIGGPAAAGLLIASVGLGGAYVADVASFVVSIVALGAVRAVPPASEAGLPSLRGMLDGFRYARSRPDLLGTYLVDMNAMFFGMPTALFPALAARIGKGAGALGLLYAAPAVGAMVVSIGSGWVSRVPHRGQAILWSATGWGVAIIAFGLATSVPYAVGFLALAGGADMVSGLFRMTMWNESVPGQVRGRVAAIEIISYTSGPSLGNVEAGAVASVAGVQTSIVSGGVLCVVGCAVVAALLPAFRRYDATAPPLTAATGAP